MQPGGWRPSSDPKRKAPRRGDERAEFAEAAEGGFTEIGIEGGKPCPRPLILRLPLQPGILEALQLLVPDELAPASTFLNLGLHIPLVLIF